MFAFKGENSIKLGLWSTIHTPLVVAKDIHCVSFKEVKKCRKGPIQLLGQSPAFLTVWWYY